MRLTRLRFRREFASGWLNFQNESTALDMPNLHARSFALARWKLREWLFALGGTSEATTTAASTKPNKTAQIR